MRIASVLPSATEIVCALGARADLVGRSEECDYPGTVRRLPVIMRARTLDGDFPSGEIDGRVRDSLGRQESLYSLDLDRLRQLRPDVLLTQDLCRVCSVTDAEVAEACTASGIAPRVVSLSPARLDDVWASIERIGTEVGRTAEGQRLGLALRRATSSPASAGPKPRVAVLEWLDPPMLAGLWVPDLVARAGGQPVGPRPGEHGLRLSWAAVADLAPDLVVVSPCSFSVERSRAELRRGRMGDALAGLHPVLGTWIADEAYFSRPGPRLAFGVELVRSLLRGVPPTAPMPVDRWAAPREVAAR